MSNRIPVEELVEVNEYRRNISRIITLPSDFPEIGRIIDSEARLEIIKATAQDGAVRLDGVIKWFITYRPADGSSRVITYQKSIELDQVLDFEEARFGMEVDAEVITRMVEVREVGDRRISLRLPVIYRVRVYREDDMTYIVKDNGYTIITRPYTMEKGVIEKEVERTIDTTETIPESIDASTDILGTDSKIIVNTVETRRDSVIIRGEILTNIIYVTSRGQIVSRRLRSYYDEKVRISGVNEAMQAYVEATILREESLYQGGSSISLSYDVSFNILVITEEEVDIPVEIIDTDLFPQQEYILVERRVTEEKTKFLVSEDLIIPENQPDAAKVIKSTAKIGEQGVDILDDGIIIEGDGEVSHLYVSTAPDQPVYSVRDIFPFSKFIDIPGLDEDNRVYAEVRVDKVRTNLIDERTIKSNIILEAKILVTELVRVPVIVGVGEEDNGNYDDDDIIGSDYQRYIVRSGDSLWVIARRFGVSVEEITQLNNISANTSLEIGQELLIPS